MKKLLFVLSLVGFTSVAFAEDTKPATTVAADKVAEAQAKSLEAQKNAAEAQKKAMADANAALNNVDAQMDLAKEQMKKQGMSDKDIDAQVVEMKKQIEAAKQNAAN